MPLKNSVINTGFFYLIVNFTCQKKQLKLLCFCNSSQKKGFPDLSKTSKEITPDKFAGFLAWLAPDAETAGVEYERLRFRLINFFANRNCRFAEDLTDETINRVTLKIGAETIENKLLLFMDLRKIFISNQSERKKII